MTARDFIYWLQGFFELSEEDSKEVTLTQKQVQTIKNHLNLVFYHDIDPSYTSDKGKIQEMNDLHNNVKSTTEEKKPKGGERSSGRDIVYRC